METLVQKVQGRMLQYFEHVERSIALDYKRLDYNISNEYNMSEKTEEQVDRLCQRGPTAK